MRLLVTGCKGQLGRELSGILEQRMPGKTLYTDIDVLDLTDAEAVREFVIDHDINRIVNCAAYTDVDRAETEGAACRAANIDAVVNLARAAEDNGAKIIHLSTDYVFDGTLNRPYTESDKANPLSQYGASKRQGETVLLARCPDAIVIRTQWLYSATGNNFVNKIIKRAREQDTLTVVNDQIGTPTNAHDLACAIHTILTAPQWMPGVYHYSNEGVASWFDVAHATLSLAGITGCRLIPCSTAERPAPARRPLYAVLDKTRIRKTFNLDIPHWADSLRLCLTPDKK